MPEMQVSQCQQRKLDKKELAKQFISNALARCEQFGVTVVLDRRGKASLQGTASPLRVGDLIFRVD